MWPQRTEVRWSHDWGVGGQAHSCSVPSSWCHRLHGLLPRCPGSALGDELKRDHPHHSQGSASPVSISSTPASVLQGPSITQASEGAKPLCPLGDPGANGAGKGCPWGQGYSGDLNQCGMGCLHQDQQQPLVFCRVFSHRHPLGPPPLPGSQGSGRVLPLLHGAVALNYLLL